MTLILLFSPAHLPLENPLLYKLQLCSATSFFTEEGRSCSFDEFTQGVFLPSLPSG